MDARKPAKVQAQDELTALPVDPNRPWSDTETRRFVVRITTFLRRGVNASSAVGLAERLHLRDQVGDDRRLRMCLECQHLTGQFGTGWHCGTPDTAGVINPLPVDLAALPHHCPAFRELS